MNGGKGVDSESWTCQGCGGRMIGRRPADDRCPDCGAATAPQATAGPYTTEREAREAPAVRAVWAAFDAAPGAGRMTALNLRMLLDACSAAGVTVGAYDVRILEWLAGLEPQMCAVIAGLIERAGRDGAR